MTRWSMTGESDSAIVALLKVDKDFVLSLPAPTLAQLGNYAPSFRPLSSGPPTVAGSIEWVIS